MDLYIYICSVLVKNKLGFGYSNIVDYEFDMC